MKTKTINLYNFDELTSEQQSKAIENLRDINTDRDWFIFTIDDWEEKLERQGFESPKIYFSGFCSQGDGACFIANINLSKFLKGRRVATKYSKELKDFESGDLSASIKTSGNYCHEYTMNVHSYDLSQELENFIINEAREQARKIYKELEKEYFYLISDEAIIETIKDNDYLFNNNGEIESE